MDYEFDLTKENLKRSLTEDILYRNAKINVLLKLINSLKKNTIIAIDGAWGTGKSVFVKQIETLNSKLTDDNGQEINFKNIDKNIMDEFNKNHVVYYYNAWENDLHTDPLQSLLLFLLNELPEHEDFIVDFEEFKKILPKHIFKILGSTLFSGINTKAKDIVGIDFKEAIEETFDLVKDIKKLKDYKGLAENIITTNEIKEAIDELINGLLKQNFKIVFIIDELDRCRPDYAVKLLETITHFYRNDKIVFLVSSNNEQLSHTVSKFYGNDFDGYAYLNKIYNFVVSLEKVNQEKYINSVFKTRLGSSWIDEMSLAIMDYYNFSMREIGRYMYYKEILANYFSSNYLNFQDNDIVKHVFLPYCLGLKLKDIKKYHSFLSGKGIDDFITFLSKSARCKNIASNIFIHSSGLDEEQIKNTSIEDYVKSLYEKYFLFDIDDLRVQSSNSRFFDVLSMISNFSNIS